MKHIEKTHSIAHRIGLLVPSSNSTQEPEFMQMLPASVSLHVTRLARLNAAPRDAMRLPEVAAGLDKMGLLPLTMSAEEFAAYVRKENERWAAVVKAAGIKPE